MLKILSCRYLNSEPISFINSSKQLIYLLNSCLDDYACVIARSSQGGGGGQTLLFDSVVIKNPGKNNELLASKVYSFLKEDIPETYLIQNSDLNASINLKLSTVKHAVQIPSDEPLLVMARVNGKNLHEYLMQIKNLSTDQMSVELGFIGKELGRIAVKDIVTGNWDRVISLSNKAKLGPYINFGNVMVQIKNGVRKLGVPVVVIDNDIPANTRERSSIVCNWILELPFEQNDVKQEIASCVKESLQLKIGRESILDKSIEDSIVEGVTESFQQISLIDENNWNLEIGDESLDFLKKNILDFSTYLKGE